MGIASWEERYKGRTRPSEDFAAAPVPLLVRIASEMRAGTALDLACGTGRNAIWLAEHGWQVSAVDGAPSAIGVLRERALERDLTIDAVVADLERGEYEIPADRWNLVAICYYLQRSLFAPAKAAVIPGGMLLAIVHITTGDAEEGPYRLLPGELKNYFRDWEILHYHEGEPSDPAHRRAVAEMVARKPL